MSGGGLSRLLRAYRVLGLPRRLSELEVRVSELEEQARARRAEFDLFKSSVEVPTSLVEEFFAWKASRPVPAEPLVSVTVVTYNRARLLTERCLPSILNQSYRNLEIIVVGDCCTDETAELVGRIKDPRLKFDNLAERGRYPSDPHLRWMVSGFYAVNRAMSMVTGDFVCHLDDDDEYMPDRVEKLVGFAAENGCDFVWHPFWAENERGEWLLNDAPEFAVEMITTGSVFYRAWFAHNVRVNYYTYLTREPGDWNRYRRIKYINPVSMRYPEPLLRHYREGTQKLAAAAGGQQ
jgi:glycosyltransferase involved in cell wall biosynthesis